MPKHLFIHPVQSKRRLLSLSALSLLGLTAPTAFAQSYPVTAGQRATADQVAQNGVPESELAAGAPEQYTVKAGDTLWGVSGLYLQKPWRWPELWGMNLQQIHNPHLIFPGQTLYLLRVNGVARLSTARSNASDDDAVIKISPRSRYESLSDNALPTLRTQLIEPFLSEPIIVEEDALLKAPHIVSAGENRVLISKGDRAYARGDASAPLVIGPGKPRDFRVFRNATPIKDPNTGKVLGYEAQFLGRAHLERSESRDILAAAPKRTPKPSTLGNHDYPVEVKDEADETEVVAATIDIVSNKEEIASGDRLLPEPPREFRSYVPHAPQQRIERGRIASVYGSDAVANAGQNQIVALNLGSLDGIENGHVMAILTDGAHVVDKLDPDKARIKLPNERNGLLMVFRTFDHISYALILQIEQAVHVGDRVINPV